MADSTVDATDANGQAATGENPAETNHVVPDKSKVITLTPQQLEERLARARPTDYDDLKAKAARLDDIEAANKSEIEKATDALHAAQVERDTAKAEALRFRTATKFGISDEDADLFLTGTDEQTLTKQAERLAAHQRDLENPRAPKPDFRQGRSDGGAGMSTAQQFASVIGDALSR